MEYLQGLFIGFSLQKKRRKNENAKQNKTKRIENIELLRSPFLAFTSDISLDKFIGKGSKQKMMKQKKSNI